ncbi:MAG TPA: SDR family NAD(P)-dependent oxidoreductase [Streptosporangiaceae bacterium]|nr:SDR family NAD(P)-dependent oxidoreductase [Streptosporangiaceae bacterium]
MTDAAPVALVTGAAGGIGRAVVQLLLDRGYSIVAEDISPKVHELAQTPGGRVISLEADVARTESAKAAVDLATSTFGRLDLVVNNAGLFLRKPTEQCTDEDFDVLMATNVRGAFIHARESLPALAQTRGSIVNLASISGLVGMPGQTVYAMTKGAIVQLTRQLAVEHAHRGIRVNAVAPGAVDTGFVAHARDAAADPDPAASRASAISQHPIGRILTPAEIAEAIVFLASPAASAITGAILPVDGGYVAR